MVFSSLIFLYAFLPLCLAGYFLCTSLKAKNVCLLLFSLAFYTWGEPKYVLLLMAMSFFDWFFARMLDRTAKERTGIRKMWVLFACIVNIGMIGLFKYGKMFCSTFGIMPDFVANITLPLGISFYTFQLLSYVIDVYRGDAPAQKEYWHVLLFAALFHQCIAGPIVRYKTIASELFVKRKEKTNIGQGCFRFALGLAKKVIIANALGSLVDSLILSDTTLASAALLESNISLLSKLPVLGAWLGLFAATLQIYFDFSAYSDMAIGLGLMVGLHYPENFNYPYTSKTAGEYWRRWHMTLGGWFRDYLYYPITFGPGVKIRKFFNKHGGRKVAIFVQNLFTMLVVWGCTGLWHGASWGYVLWGLYWCFWMLMEQYFLERWFKKLPGFIPHIYMILVMLISRALFRFGNLSYSFAVIRGMFGLNGNALYDFSTVTLLKNNLYLIIFAVIAVTPLIRNILLKIKVGMDKFFLTRGISNLVAYGVIPVALLILSTAALVGAKYNPFLYYRF